MIRSLLFDLGDVLVGLDFERAYRAFAKRSEHPPETIPHLIGATDLARPYELGEITSQQFHERFCKALAIDCDYEEFRRIWEDMFLPEPLVPEPVLEALSDKYRLVLVSNTNEIHFQSIRRRFPLLRHFDDFVLSYQVQSLKPSEKIYQEAIRVSGCTAEECFFADDKAENVQAAKRAGIDAVQFAGRGSLERHLRQRGVLPLPDKAS